MSKVLTSLPVGERVGIAFSGGLDTSVAVAWMRDQGRRPVHLHRRHRPVRRARHRRRPGPRACSTAPSWPALVDCRRELVEEGLAALACGAFHIRSAGRAYFNTTPLGRAVTGTMLVRAMQSDDVHIWGDGSTFKGNDIERFYRYGLLANPGLRIYKPWLDADFVDELGGRAEMSQWLVEHDLPYRDSKEKAYSTDANIWGATHEAKTLEHLDVSLETVEPIMGVRFWDPAVAIETEDVTVSFDGGPPGRDQRRRLRRPGRAGPRGQRDRRPARARACPTRSRTGSSRPSRRGIYEAPGMALLWIAYERLLNAIHNEDTIANYHAEGRRLGRLLYEGRWLDPQSLMLRESIQRWVASLVTGEVTLRLRRGEDYSVLDTRGPDLLLPPGQAVDGAHRERRLRPGRPHRPADDAQPRHRRLAREARAVRRDGPAHRPGGVRRRDRAGPGRVRSPAAARATRSTSPPWSARRWSRGRTRCRRLVSTFGGHSHRKCSQGRRPPNR